MFDAGQFIEESRRKIRDFRHRATWLKVASNVGAIVVIAIFITAVVQAILRQVYASGGQRQAETIWSFFGQHIHPLWVFVLVLPFPKTFPRGNEDLLPWGIASAFYLGIIMFCVLVKRRGITLRAIADKAEETLNLQEPLLLQMSAFAAAAGQNATVGNIVGNGNTVNATNSVTHVLQEGEKGNFTSKFLISLAVPVAVAFINHIFHLT